MASKWLETGPDECVAAAAEQALRERFRVVLRYLPLAAKVDENRDHVHQLRIASRRAVAALEIFQPLLPPRRVRKIGKELRRIRRSLGVARDLDVLAGRLETLAQQGENGAVTTVLGRIRKLRRRAQKPVRKVYRRARQIRLKRQMNRLARRVRHPQEHHFGPFARVGMRHVVDGFFRAAASDLSDIENLHSLRIAGKQLRYAMEIYAGAFGATIHDDLYPFFSDVQERLGAINDHASAQRLFSEWQLSVENKRAARRMGQLLEVEECLLQKSQEAFLEWWTSERAAALKDRFEGALAEPSVEGSLNPVVYGAGITPPSIEALLTSGSR